MSGVPNSRSASRLPPATRIAPRERAIAAFLLLLMVLGSVVLWVGVPVGGLWLASKLTDSFGLHMPIALAIIIPALFLGAGALAWLNSLYLRVISAGEEDPPRMPWQARRRGPLEPILAITFGIAVIALFVWFFMFAHNPSSSVL
jgi:hypothetical protein